MQTKFFFFPGPDSSGGSTDTDTDTAVDTSTDASMSSTDTSPGASDPSSSSATGNDSSATGSSSGSAAVPVTIHYDVNLVPQPDGSSCWAASSAMVLSYWRDVNAGSSSTPYTVQQIKDMVNNSGTTYDISGGLKPEDTVAVGAVLGLTFDYPMCYAVSGFADTLKSKGPLVFIRASMGGKGAHAIVIVGMNGDGTNDGTNVETLNPDPENVGAAQTVTFTALMAKMEQLGFWDNTDWAKDGGADRVYVMYKKQ